MHKPLALQCQKHSKSQLKFHRLQQMVKVYNLPKFAKYVKKDKTRVQIQNAPKFSGRLADASISDELHRILVRF